jgi:hypothetical protein
MEPDWSNKQGTRAATNPIRLARLTSKVLNNHTCPSHFTQNNTVRHRTTVLRSSTNTTTTATTTRFTPFTPSRRYCWVFVERLAVGDLDVEQNNPLSLAPLMGNGGRRKHLGRPTAARLIVRRDEATPTSLKRSIVSGILK